VFPVLVTGGVRFTRDWVLANRGIDMSTGAVDVSEPAPEAPKVEPPPYTGYGTEEDSLGSVFHLVLKVTFAPLFRFIIFSAAVSCVSRPCVVGGGEQAPKKDHVKLRTYDGVVLRFEAHIKDASPIDSLRKFVIAWCGVSVFCVPPCYLWIGRSVGPSGRSGTRRMTHWQSLSHRSATLG
jgi:hypothetical protein